MTIEVCLMIFIMAVATEIWSLCRHSNHYIVQAIMLVESADGQQVLLGRAKTIPHNTMLTCLSGFVEQVETIEEACRREVMEEAGIEVGPVHIAGSQPWPMGKLHHLCTL